MNTAEIITRVCAKLREKFAPIDAIPTATSDDNGKVMTVVDGAWAAAEGGGGGSGSGFLITVSGTASEGLTLDKTGQEIIDAVNAGFSPVFKHISGNTNFYTLQNMSYVARRISIRASGWTPSFTSDSLDDYPSIAPQGGGND